MKISCVLEHNGPDSLLYAVDFPGAYSRGASPLEAIGKMPLECAAWCRWAEIAFSEPAQVVIVQEVPSELRISDADSDVIFELEKHPLTMEEYVRLRNLTLRSAADFQKLFDSIPDKENSTNPVRATFYGLVPRTAREMYHHTKNVNEYYFGETGVHAENEGNILECRQCGFEKLEKIPGFLEKAAVLGSYDEMWSLRKLLRRFLWHDRIHAKAMYRMAKRTFGENQIPDIFRFET